MSGKTKEAAVVTPVDPIDQAIEFYAVLGPLNTEYKEAQAARNAELADGGQLSAETADRWNKAKTARSDFRTAMRALARDDGSENPYAAQAEAATVGTDPAVPATRIKEVS